MAKVTLLQKVTELTEQVRILTKERDDAKNSAKCSENSKDSAREEKNALVAEVGQLHALLDALPNPIPRVVEKKDRWGGTTEIETPLIVRFAASLTRR
jgi:uncharacterized coiled-coil DUF342 family protein